MVNVPRIGEIYWVDLGEPVGHEQGFHRPGVIVSRHSFNATRSALAVVMPVTTRDRGIPSHRPLDHTACGLDRPSWVRTENFRAISHLRLGGFIGQVSPAELADLHRMLGIHLKI
ncbi:type II toxin-antitoxin system PemK/MazF family toxin [Phytomonospora sp. NPDC050363]|uniref:type II toxin-antitoxin system PemK/MazF family toxin n=1 Tax=Phytomonospora sp. NPDC050363 TaxID=3155642 RepID=UPI0034092D39